MRRAVFAFALAAAVLPVGGPAHAQGLDPATVVLTQADVPSGLTYNASQSGPQSRGGQPGYQVAFQGDPGRIATGSGNIITVINLVALPTDPVSGLDEFVAGAKQGFPGSATDLAPPPVGEDSRAFTTNAGFGPFSVSVAGMAFRRNSAVVGVMVMSAGGQPQVDEAVRLAQIVDARVAAAGQ